jgi:Tfp pilus assembly protein PilV
MKRAISQRTAAGRRIGAFTLVESLITVVIFGMTVVALITLQMFGLRNNQVVESKLGASEQARASLMRMTQEVRAARTWEIGTVAGGAFTARALGTPQVGNALRVFSTDNTNAFVTYYFNTEEQTLLRQPNGVPDSQIIATDLTNAMRFEVQDYRGVIQTNRMWRNCIRVIMEFSQFQYPLTPVGPGSHYDYYKLEFRMTPHSPPVP